jgi:hypothetical protein
MLAGPDIPQKQVEIPCGNIVCMVCADSPLKVTVVRDDENPVL